MRTKVTVQDIADALGISRNTVSKALNNSEGIADATRERIFQKAIEMGYKHFSYVNSLDEFYSLSTAAGSSRLRAMVQKSNLRMFLFILSSVYPL